MHRTVLLSPILAALALPAAAQAPMRGGIECEPTDTRFEHRCLIGLTEEGAPVEDAAFLVRADMPEMPMAHNVPPATAAPTDAPGCYEVVLPLEMDGEWLLRLELTEPRRDVVIIRHRAICSVGPVGPVGDEVIGPAGPTTSNRMDRFADEVLAGTGLRLMIGKAERGPEAIDAIARHGAAYLIAVGGAAYLVSKAIRAARPVAYQDLGMEAIYELRVEDMPVLVAVDAAGESIHTIGPARWRRDAASSPLPAR